MQLTCFSTNINDTLVFKLIIDDSSIGFQKGDVDGDLGLFKKCVVNLMSSLGLPAHLLSDDHIQEM